MKAVLRISLLVLAYVGGAIASPFEIAVANEAEFEAVDEYGLPLETETSRRARAESESTGAPEGFGNGWGGEIVESDVNVQRDTSAAVTCDMSPIQIEQQLARVDLALADKDLDRWFQHVSPLVSGRCDLPRVRDRLRRAIAVGRAQQQIRDEQISQATQRGRDRARRAARSGPPRGDWVALANSLVDVIDTARAVSEGAPIPAGPALGRDASGAVSVLRKPKVHGGDVWGGAIVDDEPNPNAFDDRNVASTGNPSGNPMLPGGSAAGPPTLASPSNCDAATYREGAQCYCRQRLHGIQDCGWQGGSADHCQKLRYRWCSVHSVGLCIGGNMSAPSTVSWLAEQPAGDPAYGTKKIVWCHNQGQEVRGDSLGNDRYAFSLLGSYRGDTHRAQVEAAAKQAVENCNAQVRQKASALLGVDLSRCVAN